MTSYRELRAIIKNVLFATLLFIFIYLITSNNQITNFTVHRKYRQ